MQTFNTKAKGKITFVRTWINGGVHVGLLDGGGYMHVGGLPVKSKKDLTTAISDDAERKAAHAWFDKKDIPVEVEKKKLVVLPDGGFQFEDGSLITSPADIVNNTTPGPVQDAMLSWFVLYQKEAEKQELKDASRIKSAVKKNQQVTEAKEITV
jgi:hypothetical protein